MNSISKTAKIEKGVILGNNNIIHDYVYLKKGSVLGDNNEIGRFSQIGPFVTMGDSNKVDYQVVLGGDPQDLDYKGEKTYLKIGNNNIFREFSTVHRGAVKGSETRISDHNYFMGYTHVAHNSIIGNHCILTNYVGLSGHTILEDYCIFGGHSGSHQFCRVGSHAMIGGMTKVNFDVPPYVLVDGVPSRVRRVNSIGIQRRGFTNSEIENIEKFYGILYDQEMGLKEAVDHLSSSFPKDPHAKIIVDFCMASKRGVMRFRDD